jgi:hypothetical protein
MSAAALLAERAATHGDADVTAITYARLKAAVGVHPGGESLLDYPLDMILVKLARIACGDAACEDHWADIAGYAEMARRMVAK